eukprot:7390050-Prymnesium_polylepis.1
MDLSPLAGHAALSAEHAAQKPPEGRVVVFIPMPNTQEEMMSRLDEVADELGIDRRVARTHGQNTIASGQRLNWAEKQLR